MKRIGGLKQQVGAGVHSLTVDGRSPARQIEECYSAIRSMGPGDTEAARETAS